MPDLGPGVLGRADPGGGVSEQFGQLSGALVGFGGELDGQGDDEVEGAPKGRGQIVVTWRVRSGRLTAVEVTFFSWATAVAHIWVAAGRVDSPRLAWGARPGPD